MRCTGSTSYGDASTSSIVIGSRNLAFGFIAAHCRVDTAISANCSGVVPKQCMCRCIASAYGPSHGRIPYGPSHSWMFVSCCTQYGISDGRARSPRGVSP